VSRKALTGGLYRLKGYPEGVPRSPLSFAFEREGMHAAHEVNGPRFAHAILTTEGLLALLA
jgi:hypothetical protein